MKSCSGKINNYEIIRLKDKLGGRSFASGEIRLNKAFAYIVGDPKEGFKQMQLTSSSDSDV